VTTAGLGIHGVSREECGNRLFFRADTKFVPSITQGIALDNTQPPVAAASMLRCALQTFPKSSGAMPYCQVTNTIPAESNKNRSIASKIGNSQYFFRTLKYSQQERIQPIYFLRWKQHDRNSGSPPLQLFSKDSFNRCSAIALLRGLCFLCQKRGQRTSNPCKTRVQRGTGSHAAFKSLFHPFRVVSCSGSFPPSARRFPDRARQGTPGHAFRQPIPGGSIS